MADTQSTIDASIFAFRKRHATFDLSNEMPMATLSRVVVSLDGSIIFDAEALKKQNADYLTFIQGLLGVVQTTGGGLTMSFSSGWTQLADGGDSGAETGDFLSNSAVAEDLDVLVPGAGQLLLAVAMRYRALESTLRIQKLPAPGA